MDYCKGCGVNLQSTDPHQVGYRVRDDQDYCQRCFRLQHYGDYHDFDQNILSNRYLLEKITETEALYCWVVDLFNLEASNIKGLSTALKGKDVILCLTKRDLLPKTLNQQKIARTINQLLDCLHIELKGWVILSHHASKGLDDLVYLVKKFKRDRNIIFIGTSNAGKSTLINQLTDSLLTVSPLPKTTREFVKVETKALGVIYDSAGFVHEDSILNFLSNEDKLKLQPKSSIFPKVFQIYEPQVLFFEGFGWVKLEVESLSTVTCYFAEGFKIHRTAVDKTQAQWQRLQSEAITVSNQELISKQYTITRPTDFVIKEVGWFTLKGNFRLVETNFIQPVKLVLRRAII